MRRLMAATMGLALIAGGAQAAVTVIGGGQAEVCSKAALAELSDNASERICTNALETEMLTPYERAGTFINRGVLKLRRRSFEAATQDFDAAIHIRPDLGEAYVNRGAAAIGMGQAQHGMDDINRALALGVTEPAKAYFNRAIAYEALDDEAHAYFDYMKAQELSPDWPAPAKELLRFSVSPKP